MRHLLYRSVMVLHTLVQHLIADALELLLEVAKEVVDGLCELCGSICCWGLVGGQGLGLKLGRYGGRRFRLKEGTVRHGLRQRKMKGEERE